MAEKMHVDSMAMLRHTELLGDVIKESLEGKAARVYSCCNAFPFELVFQFYLPLLAPSSGHGGLSDALILHHLQH